MSSWWRNAMLYLGLGPDEEYEDYESRGAPGVPEPAAGDPRREPGNEHQPTPTGPVGPVPEPEPEPALTAVRPIRDPTRARARGPGTVPTRRRTARCGPFRSRAPSPMS